MWFQPELDSHKPQGLPLSQQAFRRRNYVPFVHWTESPSFLPDSSRKSENANSPWWLWKPFYTELSNKNNGGKNAPLRQWGDVESLSYTALNKISHEAKAWTLSSFQESFSHRNIFLKGTNCINVIHSACAEINPLKRAFFLLLFGERNQRGMHFSGRYNREGTAAGGASPVCCSWGFMAGVSFTIWAGGAFAIPRASTGRVQGNTSRQRDGFRVPAGTCSLTPPPARSRAGVPQPRCPVGRTVPDAPPPSPLELGKGRRRELPAPPVQIVERCNSRERREWRRAAAHLPSGQGGGADTGDLLRPRLGNQMPGEKWVDGGEPPSLPHPPSSGSGACARPGRRGGAALWAAAPGTHVGLGGTRMGIKTNRERTVAKWNRWCRKPSRKLAGQVGSALPLAAVIGRACVQGARSCQCQWAAGMSITRERAIRRYGSRFPSIHHKA